MSNGNRVVVGCTHGEEDPDRVIVAYLTAVAALDAGKEVVMWCTVEGVRLGLEGYADGIRADMDPPVSRVHAQFIEKGGRFFICPVCFKERQLDGGELIEQAELQGATPLMEFVGDGAVTFTY
jgi:predicted peroxiredoxin